MVTLLRHKDEFVYKVQINKNAQTVHFYMTAVHIKDGIYVIVTYANDDDNKVRNFVIYLLNNDLWKSYWLSLYWLIRFLAKFPDKTFYFHFSDKRLYEGLATLFQYKLPKFGKSKWVNLKQYIRNIYKRHFIENNKHIKLRLVNPKKTFGIEKSIYKEASALKTRVKQNLAVRTFKIKENAVVPACVATTLENFQAWLAEHPYYAPVRKVTTAIKNYYNYLVTINQIDDVRGN